MNEFGERFSEALARLPDYLGQHVIVSVTALALGLAISLPLAVFATPCSRCSIRCSSAFRR